MSNLDFEQALAAKLGTDPADASAETAAETTETETGQPAEQPTEQERLLAGKYRNAEELERAYGELENKLGEQGSRIGELERTLEQRESERDQPSYDRGQVAVWLDEHEQQAPAIAHQARLAGDTVLYDAAMDKWYEIAPRQASAYERWVELGQFEERLTARTAQEVAPAQQLAQREQLEAAVDAVRSKHEDFAQVIGTLNEQRLAEILSTGFPTELLEGLAAGDQASKEKVLETLYRWTKAEQSGPISEAAHAAAREAEEEVRAGKLAAALPTAASAATEEEAPDGKTIFRDAFRRNFGLEPLLKEQ